MDIVCADIGGTHARFALAALEGDRVTQVRCGCVLKTGDYHGFETAWAAFAAQLGTQAPRIASIAVAGPVDDLRSDEEFRFTNNAWRLRPAEAKRALGLDELLLVNDFAAVAHAVARLGETCFKPVCGPNAPLPADGVISVIGPGTGLGVAQIVRHRGSYQVIGTEGGHISFAPVDAIDDHILAHLRKRHGRVSAERVVSGPGLVAIHQALADLEGRSSPAPDDGALWNAAASGAAADAVAALQRFCCAYGATAGDIALAQGADAVVLAGGLSARVLDRLIGSEFAARFCAKGRFRPRMEAMPVKLIAHQQPGLYGAAAAYLWEMARGACGRDSV